MTRPLGLGTIELSSMTIYDHDRFSATSSDSKPSARAMEMAWHWLNKNPSFPGNVETNILLSNLELGVSYVQKNLCDPTMKAKQFQTNKTMIATYSNDDAATKKNFSLRSDV